MRGWLRLEGGAVFGLAVALWAYGAHSWALFAALFFVPDVAALGYLRGARVGAACYNAAHTYVFPLALYGAGMAAPRPLACSVALVWAAHIGFDRALGYGLKRPHAFGITHLSRVGRPR